ncbi:GNAT family N-acetyltransferase [Nonlabens antarcticus]|uniref:GNAT family N-acetyltransferase n=1 Tax=Nonlabens antarcticus TaxID=392714 RepID=UPI0018913AEC|nr:GNAT family N-acetyltransferase [Nonlabens antarcticus]
MYSERLTYRLLEAKNLDSVHRLHSIPEVDQFNALGIPEDEKVTKEILNNWVTENDKEERISRTYAIKLKTDEFIGIFGIKYSNAKYQKAEVWFKFDPQFWNKGYATEALNYFLKQCFTRDELHRVEAGCAVENHGSKKVLEKCGFVQEGIQRQNLPLKSGWSDNFEFGLLREEWEK